MPAFTEQFCKAQHANMSKSRNKSNNMQCTSLFSFNANPLTEILLSLLPPLSLQYTTVLLDTSGCCCFIVYLAKLHTLCRWGPHLCRLGVDLSSTVRLSLLPLTKPSTKAETRFCSCEDHFGKPYELKTRPTCPKNVL